MVVMHIVDEKRSMRRAVDGLCWVGTLAVLGLACGSTTVVQVLGGAVGGGGSGEGGESGVGGAPSVGGGGSEGDVIAVGVPAVHVVADPLRRVFYATVAGTSPDHSNSLIVVDESGAIISSVYVGSQPSTLALSHDASTLWIGLVGTASLRRVDVTVVPPAPGAEHPLPPGLGNGAYPGPMVVLPDSTESLALSVLRPNYYFSATMVLDDGVPRPMKIETSYGPSRLIGGPEGWLFGLNDQHTGLEIFSVEVHAEGLNAYAFGGLIDDFADIASAPGWLFSTNGEVIDVEHPLAPKKTGAIAFAGDAVLPLEQGAELLMLEKTAMFDGVPEEDYVLRQFHVATYAPLAECPLRGAKGDRARDLVSIEGETLAFVSLKNWDDPFELYVLPNPFEE